MQGPARVPYRDWPAIALPFETVAGGLEVVRSQVSDGVSDNRVVDRWEQSTAWPKDSPHLGRFRCPVLKIVLHKRGVRIV